MEICLKCTENGEELETVSECRHSICHRCLCEGLKDITSTKISCPLENCPNVIDEDIVKKCLSNDKLCLFNILKFSNNSTQCLVKNCNNFTIVKENAEHFICSRCEQYNCLRCQKLHIPEESCDNITDCMQSEIQSKANDILKRKVRTELISLYKENNLIPNPDYFECYVCAKLVLPRAGVVLRNCLHSFCTDCLKNSMADIHYISQITCMFKECRKSLDSSEILAVINEEKFLKMMIKEASSRFFLCKNGDCSGIADIISDEKFYRCLECGQRNCLNCLDIHEGLSCQEFMKTKRYTSPEDQQKAISENQYVKCIVCTHILIKDTGCSSMFCCKCGNSTCVFTGKKPGKHNHKICRCDGVTHCSDSDKFCECSSLNPCNVNCLYGCHSEDL